MNAIKVEVNEEDNFRYDSCFCCLQSATQSNNEEFINSLSFFFNYLKIQDKIEFVVCEKCGENLSKFAKLSNILEKIRLEMDYLLDFIKCKILSSNNIKPMHSRVASARKMVIEKCLEKMEKTQKPQIILRRVDTCRINLMDENINDKFQSPPPTPLKDNRKPQIILQRLDLSKLIKRERQQSQPPSSDCTDDWLPNSENDFDYDSTSSDSDTSESSATSGEIKYTKSDINATICEENFTSKVTKLKCTKCSKTFPNKGNLNRHNNLVHLRLKPFKCSRCDKAFPGIGNLRNHVKNHHFNLTTYKCDMCDKPFRNLKRLTRHKLTHSKPKQVHTQKHLCYICKKMFKSRKNLYQHISFVHKKQRHYCQAGGCDKNYCSKRYLKEHYRKEHPDFKFTVGKRPGYYATKFKVINENKNVSVECLLCRGLYKTVKSAKFHLRKVHGCVQFKCKVCWYKSESKEDLDTHIKKEHVTHHVPNEENGNKVTIVKIENDSMCKDD